MIGMIDAQSAELLIKIGGWITFASGLAIIASGIGLGASGALTRKEGGYGLPTRPRLAGQAYLLLLGASACALIGIVTAAFGVLAG